MKGQLSLWINGTGASALGDSPHRNLLVDAHLLVVRVRLGTCAPLLDGLDDGLAEPEEDCSAKKEDGR